MRSLSVQRTRGLALIAALILLSVAAAVFAAAPWQQERRLDDGIVDTPYEYDQLYKSEEGTEGAGVDR